MLERRLLFLVSGQSLFGQLSQARVVIRSYERKSDVEATMLGINDAGGGDLDFVGGSGG